MHLLVSFCNLMAPGTPSLGLFDPTTGELRVLEPPDELSRYGGVTGLAACPRHLYVVAQPRAGASAGSESSECALLVLDRRDLSLQSLHPFRSGRDVHSLGLGDGVLYAVSTGTDEILELRLRGDRVVSETVFWRPEPDGPRTDVHHVNAIRRWHGDWIVAGFGKKSAQPWSSARDGFVINLSRGDEIARGIDQPHSLAEVSGQLACCESRKLAIRLLGDSRVQHLPGYTRGLAVVEDSLFVATSVGRQFSRSTGRINNPAAEGVLGGQCSISRLSASTLDIEQTMDLGTYAREIYDLLPIEGVERWRAVGETAWRDRSLRGLAAVVDQRTAWANQATATLHQREAALAELQASLAQAETVRAELAELRTAVTQQAGAVAAAEAARREVKELRERVEQQTGTLAALTRTVNFLHVAASLALQQWAPEDLRKQIDYQQLIHRIQAAVSRVVPAGATVLVISKGDDNLLALEGRPGWHFPRTPDGTYAGFHPANGAAAVAHLEELRAKGAGYLGIPATAAWWLDSYPSFRGHLQRCYRLVFRSDDTGLIYSLGEPSPWKAVAELVQEFKARHRRCPAILNWQTGGDLARAFPECAVFAPVEPDSASLPYLERSIDIVAVSSDDPRRLEEARRVASETVLRFTSGPGGLGEEEITMEWRGAAPANVRANGPGCKWRAGRQDVGPDRPV